MVGFNATSDEGERIAQAIGVLSEWSHATAPSRLARSLSVLFGGLPAIAYAPPAPTQGSRACLATANLGGDLLRTPFVTERVIFSPALASVTDNPVWGAAERPIMGEELAQDRDRWRIFRETLLVPLRVTDNLSMRITDADGNWIGWCGVFSRGSSWFTERDWSRYAAIRDPLRDMVHACHALAPTSGPAHPGLQIAHAWPEPAFAVTDAGYILFVNRSGQRELAREPEWLRDTLANRAAPPAAWQSFEIHFQRGRITVFFRARASQSCRFIDAAASAGLMLPAYLARLVGGVLRGSTVPELARSLGKSTATVATYVARIRDHVEAGNRAQLTYRVLERAFGEPDLWPIAIPAEDAPSERRAALAQPGGK